MSKKFGSQFRIGTLVKIGTDPKWRAIRFFNPVRTFIYVNGLPDAFWPQNVCAFRQPTEQAK